MKRSQIEYPLKKPVYIPHLVWNLVVPFYLRTNIRCNACGTVQKQPIDWIGSFRMMCQNGCDQTIFYDGSGQTES